MTARHRSLSLGLPLVADFPPPPLPLRTAQRCLCPKLCAPGEVGGPPPPRVICGFCARVSVCLLSLVCCAPAHSRAPGLGGPWPAHRVSLFLRPGVQGAGGRLSPSSAPCPGPSRKQLSTWRGAPGHSPLARQHVQSFAVAPSPLLEVFAQNFPLKSVFLILHTSPKLLQPFPRLSPPSGASPGPCCSLRPREGGAGGPSGCWIFHSINW